MIEAKGEEAKLSAETVMWIEARRKPGNWMAIEPSDEIPIGIESWERTLFHMFQMTFTPEISRRIAAGKIGDDFVLLAAQLIQREDGGCVIRLNNEVGGVTFIRARRARPERRTRICFRYGRAGQF